MLPNAMVIQIPIADGGEGTVDTLVTASLGYFMENEVMNGYGEHDIVPWGTIGGTQTAVMEIAAIAGLPGTPLKKRDPKMTTTYGLGELIQIAIEENCTEFLIGLGGSATNDGGAGMAQALGFQLLDKKGKEIPRGGAALLQLYSIDISKRDMRIFFKQFVGICDVDIPVIGESGTTNIFARQKGASEEDCALLEDALGNFCEVVARDLGTDIRSVAGGGASGGLGAGMAAFLNAELKRGIDFVLDRVAFDEKISGADLIITGEGKIDSQTKHGKAISGIAKRALAKKKPVIAFAGIVDEADKKLLKSLGLTSVHCITSEEETEQEAIANAASNLDRKVRSVMAQMFG